jgi:hypothetical protein
MFQAHPLHTSGVINLKTMVACLPAVAIKIWFQQLAMARGAKTYISVFSSSNRTRLYLNIDRNPPASSAVVRVISFMNQTNRVQKELLTGTQT